MIDIRLPNITATTDKGQLEQIRSYLYQLAQQLSWALSNIDGKAEQATQKIEASTQQKNAADKAQATFAEVKSLIIKSADIVDAYYEEINRRLEGIYVAESAFGTYKEKTANTLRVNSTNIDALFENTQTLKANDDYTTIIGAQAWCKIGLLGHEESGFPVYGMEIGQINTKDGQDVYNKFAQYRSDGVHLFDQNGNEVATICDLKLRITNAEINSVKITGSLDLGGYAIRTDNGLAFKWVGRG